MAYKRPKEQRVVRIKSLYLYLKDNGPMKLKELVVEFEVSDRTIQRDLFILKDNGLIEDHGRGIWQITDKKVKQFK